MRLLTSDKLAKSQLSLLLRDLGHQVTVHDSLDSLREALDNDSLVSVILIDLQYGLPESAVSLLRSTHASIRFIGFERYESPKTSLKDSSKRTPPECFAGCIVIPSNAERAKLRLKNTLRASGHVTRSNKSQRSRAPFSFKNKLLSSGVSKSLNRLKEPLPRTVVARYIITSSPSYYNLLEDLKRQDEQRTTIILQATEDVEFELVARELNFQSNQDACPLYIINPDNLRIDYLEKLERKAAKEKVPIFCYVGRSDDLDEQSATDLKLFSQYLDNLRAPHARLILGHEIGSEDLQQLGVKEHLDVLLKQSTRLEIPNLAERAADIPIICQHTISQLRSMHPFLLVQRISSETEQYLIDQRGNYSYVKLVRILRNAVALCQRDTLTVEDIKNYGESDVTTQHLLETMADENYFPQEASVNF